jgi:hypothetical protein
VAKSKKIAPSPKDEKRRLRALKASQENASPAAERLQAVYGLRLPAHLAVFDAFWRSLTPLEEKGMEYLGRLAGGIMMWFDEAGRARRPKRRLDPRLNDRFRRDPPELVTVLWGMGDGLHFGLWYDDPAELPSFVVRNYARDSSETWREEPTVLRTLARDYEDALEEEVDEPPSPGEVKALRALGAALTWWTPHDDAALEADGRRRWARTRRGEIVGGLAPALPPGAGDARATKAAADRRFALYEDGDLPRLGKLVTTAKRELARGKPAFALVLGRELHWCDDDETREVSLELLVDAYRALGRDALAEIARVHHAHRDLKSVDIYA